MTSLTDVYEGRMGTVASPQRLYLGALLSVLGAGLVVVGIVLATTGVAESMGMGMFEAREAAGTLAGLGIPAVLLGALAVLPAGRVTRAAAVIGSSLAVFGVGLFGYAYPYEWIGASGAGAGLTLATTVIYFLGTATTAWCLFLAVATLKTRNDPGGAARMDVTEHGRIRLIKEVASSPGLGGIGLLGSDPDGDVETQTNREGTAAERSQPGSDSCATGYSQPAGDSDAAGYGQPASDSDAAGFGQPASDSDAAGFGQPASDGGAAAAGEDDAFLDAATVRGQPDVYCGNCEHFSYVRTEEGIAPYCGLDERYMDDMEACEDWESNL